MGTQVFVSHSSKDHKLAMTICGALEKRGCPCWISSRDIGAGENFQEAIVGAIKSAKAMVLVFSRNANDSAEIKKELALASEYGVVVIPVRAEDVIPTGAFKYELSTRQWVDLFQNWEQAIERLADQINRIGGTGNDPAPARPLPVETRKPRGLALALGFTLLAVVIAGGGLWWMRSNGPVTLPQVKAKAGAESTKSTALELRAAPATLTGEEVAALLIKNNFYDARRNAGGRGVKHQYAAAVVGTAAVVNDAATKLMWQKGGSGENLNRAGAAGYIEKLNADKFGGFSDWRLPTLEEAMSLVEPPAQPPVQGACLIDPVFQRPPFMTWTADKSTVEDRGFVVYFCDGALSGERESFNAHVRAVRGL